MGKVLVKNIMGPGPTSGQIATAVSAYLTANPPQAGNDGVDSTVPGPPPTPLEISTAVSAYLTANPPADGADSTVPGPPPTDQAVAAAVATYLSANPPADGVDGAAVTVVEVTTANWPPADAPGVLYVKVP